MKDWKRGKACLKLLLLVQLAILSVHTAGYSCRHAMNSNWLTSYSWARCYEASDGTVIGHTKGGLSAGDWTGTSSNANWNYDYNNKITFIQTTTAVTQRWNYRYHSSDTCGNPSSTSGSYCGCGSGYNCYNSWWSNCCNRWGCWDCYPYIFARQWDYWNDDAITTVLYLPCHYYCSTCTASWTHTSCQSCWNLNGAAYRWLAWGSATNYIDTCHDYCPNDEHNGYSNVYPGTYIISSNPYNPLCGQCNTACSVCANNQGGQVCSVCVSNAALLQNNLLCTQAFPNDPYCQTDNQCVFNNCPTNLYFWLPRSQTSNSSYPFTATGASNLRVTNVCYLCHRYCLTCTDQYDFTCGSCAFSYYFWQQYPNRCNYYCNEGVYTSGGTRGQYVISTTNRACGTCDVGCKFCASTSSKCYICQDSHFLVDNKVTCAARFNCKQCTNASVVTDGCAANDNFCRLTNCPAFFYFRVNRTSTGNVHDAPTNPIYQYFTKVSTEALDTTLNGYQLGTTRAGNSSYPSPHGANSTYYYRQLTNLCVLCDSRCMQCFGPTNLNCTLCTNNYYKWTNATVCSSLCPEGQFQLNISAPYPDNETMCGNCDPKCIACVGYLNNCTKCVSFPNSNYAFLYTYFLQNSTCMVSCPVSTNPLTTKGFYGSIATMVCYPCPGQCSNCNIANVMNIASFPELQPIACGGDYLCSKGIICTACLQGYSLAGGLCVDQTSCRLYSYYKKSSTSSSAWSPTNCVCVDGYYSIGSLTCAPCDISCLTCNGSSSSNCLSCPVGYSLSSNTCQSTNTGSQVYTNYYWVSTSGFNSFISTSYNAKFNCGSYHTLFGYKSSQSTSSTFTYSTGTLSGQNYYAISFRLRILFIDNWDTTASIFFKLGSNSNPSFIYNYNDYGAIGQMQCGTNVNDYLLTVAGQITVIPTAANQAWTISAYSNTNPVQNSSGFYYYWGIQSAFFTVLSCHSDCGSCTGPSASQCTSCTDTAKTVKNGRCVCDSSRNFYYVVGSTTNCQTGCNYCNSSTNANACYYRDTLTATCVNPPIVNCSAPNIYGDNYNIVNFYGTCVQSCGSGLYAIPSLMKCTTACHNFGMFFYKGATGVGTAMWTCVKACPSGMMLDLTTVSCVTSCPYYSSNNTRYFFQLQDRTTNPMCVINCTTGYEYDNQNRCVMACPVGYYTQTISAHNKCVQKCATDTYGDNKTLSCVAVCPPPSIADPSTNLCVNECPNGYYFQINSQFGNRTCVTRCQAVQWLHPYFLNCSMNPMDCPIGTYADNSTNKCEFSCKVFGQVGQNTTRMCQTKCNTGYAFWDVGLCVVECNMTMFGFIDSTRRQCVSNCNANGTSTFADIQADRTCVKNCSHRPYASFGQNRQSTCTKLCPSGQFGDPFHPYRLCVNVCTNFPNQTFAYALTRLCVTRCPVGFYGDNYTVSRVGVCSTSCPNGYYGDPLANLCVVRCPFRYYGSQIDGRPCVTTCPDGYFATNLTSNRVCTTVCDQGFWADNYTRMCHNVKTSCSNNTYADAQKRLCVVGTNCTVGTYADPVTMGCETACRNSTFFGNPSNNLCVRLCPTNPDYYSQGGYCTATCSGGFFADYQANRTCLARCTASPVSLYGTTSFRCVEAKLCGTGLFGNNNTRLCSTCSGSLPFGDPITFQCVFNCSLTYYGDKNTNLCVLNCNFALLEYADNFTQQCTPVCTLGTFGVNSTVGPVCQRSCPPNSYALDTNRVCMLNCGTGFFGDPITGKCYNSSLNCSSGYFGNTVTNMCVLPQYCQIVAGLHYYADNTTKRCISKCTSPNYGLNTTWYCVASCPNPLYAENNTRICLIVSGCGQFSSFADSQINICVTRCSTSPVFTYAENITFTCVTPDRCPTTMLAENTTQSCVYHCPHNSSYFSFADPYKSNRCVAKCPDGYYGDTSSGRGLCASVCPGLNYFRDNTTQLCVYVCPAANSALGTSDTFGDNTTDMCVNTCPVNYFAQVQVNRTCVMVCMASTWGNLITRRCITNPVTSCPAGTWADNFTNLCTGLCSSNSSNSQIFYGENITKLCVPSCPVPSFAFIGTRVCIDICPVTIANTPGFFGDPGTTPTRLCVTTCMTTGLYRDVANNRTCQPTCTYNSTYRTYQNPTLMTCTAECPTFPQYLYAWASNSTNAICTSSCPTGYMNDANMSCVATCPYLLDPTTNRCVSACPFNSATNTILYANLVTLVCVSADSCPSNTYASEDSLTCVSRCPNNTYIFGKNCVSFCPNGFYINFVTQTCVVPTGCPSNHFANNQTTSCVSACTNGTFGDSATRQCITTCYGTNFADPLTRLCSSSCSTGLVKNALTFSCVSSCAVGTFYNIQNLSCTTTCQSPYYADDKSQTCVLVCSSNPMTFGSTNPVRACATSCPSTAQWFDLINRVCTATCPAGSYQYSVNSSCVSFCPAPHFLLSSMSICVLNCTFNGISGMFADSTTQNCVSLCPIGYFADPTTFKCVLSCPINPARHYADSITRRCVTACPSNRFADNQKGACVAQCSIAPLTYADSSSGRCVHSCPVSSGTFADPTTQRCVARCPTGYFADNRQRMCLNNCSNIFYADSQTNPPACVSTCTSGYFADPLLFRCVTTCSASYFAFQPSGTCLQFCPFGYFANPTSKYCVTQCLISPNLYADNFTRTCTNVCSNNQFNYKPVTQSNGICVYYCPTGYFADNRTMSCVTHCPSGLFGSTVNNTCNSGCPESYFKDTINKLCQSVCPSANQLFGDPYTRTCILTCNSTGYSNMYADSISRLCVPTCSGSQYADPRTLKCVGISQCSIGTNADSHMKKCVSRCYNKTYAYNGICYANCPSTSSLALFADEQSQRCVTARNCARGLFADPSKGKCVIACDIASGAFADAATGMCVTNCLFPLYADNITRTCASVCTSVPLYYAINSSRICAPNCPANSYADPIINLCVQRCSNGLYGDSSTWACVRECPRGTFGNNITNLCVTTCPSNPAYFGDMFTKTCVFSCSNRLYADAARNRECHPTCLSPTFSENSTMQCVFFCLTGFADKRTGRCIANCTRGFYGFNFICHESQCPSTNPQRYADDSTNLCVLQCPHGTFAEPNTRKCVRICPIEFREFADTTNRLCSTSCPFGTYADSSTRICVSTCPSIPSLFGINSVCAPNCTAGLFADNSTRTCVQTCPNGTFADNSTWTCVSYCPSKPMYFADSLTNICVLRCSQVFDYYADNSTRSCVLNCSNRTYADPVSRTCKSVCPSGYFGVNSTLRCERTCPAFSFADRLINLCVAKCSVDPIFYGDTATTTCLQVCPANSFGNPLTQQCAYNNATVSTCPGEYYANPRNQLCTQVCPMRFDLYAEPISKMCRTACVSPYIADNSTMRCVLVCPSYPNYYANTVTGRCVKYCPLNTYADNSTRVCVRACPNGTYAQNSTWRCVTSCPNRPLTLRDPLNWRCVAVCPPSYFSDSINLLCVPSCSSDIDGFARNDTRQCVKTCPVNTFAFLPTRRCVASCYDNTYADNSTRTCVSVCPRSPALFADSVAMTCVTRCPAGMFAFEDTRECVFSCPVIGFFRENSSRLCVRSCNVTERSYTDNLTGFCVVRCSFGTYADPTTRRCVSMCPDQPLMYAENNTQSCVSVCPNNLYGENNTRTCVTGCPNGSLSLPQKNLCVFICPIGTYAYLLTQFCVQVCPFPLYGDPSTRSCVPKCPINQLLYADNSTMTCVSKCPSGSYAYQWSVACLPSCPVAVPPFVQTYAASYDNTCVQQCAYPFYSYDVTFKCLTSCPNPYFNNLESHQCQPCPSACSSCTGRVSCTSCFFGFFLQNGVCVSNCTLSYYANSITRTCVTSRSCSPNYGENSTKTCKSSCAVGSFANNALYRCDACPLTCISCTSLNNCLTCVSASVLSNNFCYGYCDNTSTSISYYSYNDDDDNYTCTNTCPDGTYASIVFCINCDSSCSTCSISPNNCTNCSNGKYLYNGGCVSTCPTNFKPNINRLCISCDGACGAGLTFDTNVTNVNGQPSLFFNFNSAINFTGNLYSTFAVTSSGRRLLQTGSPGYQIIVIDPQTVQIVFPPGTSSTNLNVQIANPQNIVDSNGNLPSSLSASVKLDGSSLYSTSLSQAPNQFPLYFTFLGIICVISFIFDIQLMKFLQIVYVHYFIAANLPPEFTKVFMGIKFSTLNYLPRLFSVQKAVLRPSVPSSVYSILGDYNFLRNAGFAFTPLLIILIVWGLLKLLSVPEINNFKTVRVYCQNLFEEKFKFAVLLEWVGMFMLNTVFFAFLQLRDYNIYDDFTQASLILAHVFIFFFFIVCILVAYRVLSFYQQYPILSDNLKKAADIILQDDEADHLVSTNVFLSEKKKIDLRNMYYPKINNENIFPFKCIYRYNIFSLLCLNVTILRAILLSAFISLPKDNPLLQMGLCLPLNVLTLLYFCKGRPYTFKFRRYRIKNYVAIYHEACLIIFELLMLVFAIKDQNNSTAAQKEQFSYLIIYYLTFVCSISFVYHLFASGVFIYRKVWLVFIESDIFKRNFAEKYAEYQAAKNKQKKLVKSIDPKAKEALKSMIKGYKKTKSVLRPTENEKANSQLPVKYKLTYMDKTQTSSLNSGITLSKFQKKKMLKEIFNPNEKLAVPEKEEQKYEVINENSQANDFEYEEYEEIIQIEAKDLQNYVQNAAALLRTTIPVQEL